MLNVVIVARGLEEVSHLGRLCEPSIDRLVAFSVNYLVSTDQMAVGDYGCSLKIYYDKNTDSGNVIEVSTRLPAVRTSIPQYPANHCDEALFLLDVWEVCLA